MSTSPCAAGFLSRVFSGNEIVCNSSFQNMETTNATSQIQSVVDNADTFYDDTVSSVAQTAATQQEAQVSFDVANVTDAISSSTAGQFFSTCPDGNGGIAIPGGPCIDYEYLIFGVLALVALYFIAIFSSFIPKR